MKTRILTVVLIAGLQLNCASSPESTEKSQSLIQSAAAAPIVGAPAYSHSLDHSKFAIGSSAVARDEFGMHKIVGDQGVFATRVSGLVTAITNADASARKGTPIADAAAHNDAVRQYFLQAGLPPDQIDSVQDFEVVSVPDSSTGSTPKRTVQSRYSMITRQVRGILVPDSFAWARMNVDGTVVEEQVYWPVIPQSAIDDALAFSTRLADNATLAAFEGQLPAHEKDKGVVIRHSPGEWDKSFVVGAYYDIRQQRDSFATILHANQAGAIVTLPFEQPGAWGPDGSTPRKTP